MYEQTRSRKESRNDQNSLAPRPTPQQQSPRRCFTLSLSFMLALTPECLYLYLSFEVAKITRCQHEFEQIHRYKRLYQHQHQCNQGQVQAKTSKQLKTPPGMSRQSPVFFSSSSPSTFLLNTRNTLQSNMLYQSLLLHYLRKVCIEPILQSVSLREIIEWFPQPIPQQATLNLGITRNFKEEEK